MANPSAQIKKLAKFLSYVLARRPDEFGLLVDEDGFVPIKTLLQALHEEEGWRHVRMAHLNELMMTLRPAPFELEAKRIRAKDRSQIPHVEPPGPLPKLLYTAIRRRAHAAVMQKGLRTSGGSQILLSSQRAMAKRLGRRMDNQPVILTVQVANSMDKGASYQQYGRHLYLATEIATGTFSGPAPPKDRPEPAPTKSDKVPAEAGTPGSYFPDPASFQNLPNKAAHSKRRKEADWKKERRLQRRHKSRR